MKHKKEPAILRAPFYLFVKLNDERQGEGGTLALIIVNITIGVKFAQVLLG